MTIRFDCREITIQPRGYKQVEVTVENPQLDQLISEVGVEKLISEIDHNEILEIIGKEKCCRYFNLKPDEE